MTKDLMDRALSLHNRIVNLKNHKMHLDAKIEGFEAKTIKFQTEPINVKYKTDQGYHDSFTLMGEFLDMSELLHYYQYKLDLEIRRTQDEFDQLS